MIKYHIALLLMLTMNLGGCCSQRHRDEPDLPTAVKGWKYREERGLRIRGDFVLRKGEDTNNDKIRIRVVEIIAGDACAEPASYLSNPSTKMQFIRLSDNAVLCERRFYEGSENLEPPACTQDLSSFGLLGIYVTAINVRDGWVFFELRG